MHRPSRPSNVSDGSKEVRRKDSGGDLAAEPDSPSCYRNLLRGRHSIHFPVFRRSSSGYFSTESESLPSSPLFSTPVTVDQSTQTPSPTGQVMNHALHRVRDESASPRVHGRSAARVMQAEVFGRHLRDIGDEYNRLIMRRRRQRWDAVVCVGLLLVLMGRLIYLQSSTNSQDSQV